MSTAIPHLDSGSKHDLFEPETKQLEESHPPVLEHEGGLIRPDFKSWHNNTAKSWWNDRGLRRCMFDVVILFGSIFANGYDSGVMSSLQANANWLEKFDSPKGQKLGAIVSAYSFPNLIFPILGSYLADRMGRKPVIFMASLCGIAGPLISALGNNLGTFVGGRLVTGVACAFFQVTAPNLIAEIAHPRFRAVVSATYLTTYYVGSFICGWVGFGMVEWGADKSWRVITALQCLGCIPLIFHSALPWMAESPRYYVKKGQQDKALKILATLHANGDDQDELVRNEFREIVVGVELDTQAAGSSYMDFFRTKGNKKRFWLVVWFSWAQSMSGNNLFAYYLPQIFMIAGISSFLSIQALSAGLVGYLLVIGVSTAQLVERLGRRKVLLWSLSLLVVFFAILTAFSGAFANSGSTGLGIACIPAIFLALTFYVSAMVPLPYLYLPEILPYALRSKGMAVFSVLTAAGQVYNAYVNAIALAAIAWKYYIVFIVTDIIQVIVAYFIVIETKGLTLEDIAILFDGNETLLAAEYVEK